VREEESLILQQYVQKYWLDYDHLTDVFDSDAAHLITIVFEGVHAFEETPEAMYDAFVTYKNEQPHLFTERANSLILATARAIAHAYAGINKSELVILHKLDMELNRL